MAASTSGAIKQFLESPLGMGGAAIGVPVHRDQAPDGALKPYVTVSEAVSIVPEKLEDGAASTVKEHITVNVWMQWKDDKGAFTESFTLPTTVAKALHGSRLLTSGSGAPPTIVYGVIVHSVGPRLLERDERIVNVPIWVEVWRAL